MYSNVIAMRSWKKMKANMAIANTQPTYECRIEKCSREQKCFDQKDSVSVDYEHVASK